MKTQKTLANKELSDWLNKFIQDLELRKSLPFETDYWLADQAETIEWICDLSPEHCVEVLIISQDAMSFIINHPANISGCMVIPYSHTLLHVAQEDDPNKFDNFIEPSALCYGYSALYLLSLKRIYLYLNEHGTRDQLYLRFADIINEDPRNIDIVELARQQLNKFAKNTFNKDKRKKNEPERQIEDDDEFNHLIGEAVIDAFNKISRNTEDPSDHIVAAAKGNEKIKYIPKRAADRYKRVELKEISYQYTMDSLDVPIYMSSDSDSKKDSLAYADALNQQELLELRENHLINSELIDISWKLLKDPKLFTDRQRQAFTMRHFASGKQPLDKDDQPTFKDIAAELGVSGPRAYKLCTEAENKLEELLGNSPE